MSEIDNRFALIATNGDVLFPYMKHQQATNRYGFALNPPGEQDRNGGGHYTKNLEEVIRRLVFDGWNARVTTVGKAGRERQGSLGIGKVAIKGYWVAPELEHLTKNAPTKPVPRPGSNAIAPDVAKRDAVTDDVDAASTPEERQVLRAIWTRRGQPAFRRALLQAYGGRCCVTGCDVEAVLEAAHIVPHAEGQDSSLRNGLLLRADIHTLFDLNLLSVDDKGQIFAAFALQGTEYEGLHGCRIAKPVDGRLQPAPENLARRFASFKR